MPDAAIIPLHPAPDLTGRVFRVQELAHKTDASARRLGVVERTH